jgi:uncharacterized membrane protein
MATLTALKFNSPGGAEATLTKIQDLAKQHLITLQDAAIVTWPAGKKKPKTKQLTGMTGLGALEGAFWGMLFGLIFFIPFLGAAIGAGMGALVGHFTDIGIDDDFIKQVRSQVTEGTSALFLLTSGATEDKVLDALKGIEAEVISTSLSQEEEDKLKAAFAVEE